jgi:hypothetical protein
VANSAAAAEVRSGLASVARDTPVRTGWVDALGTWTEQDGWAGRLEAGAKLWEPFSVYGYGQLDRFGPSAGVGARLTWHW